MPPPAGNGPQPRRRLDLSSVRAPEIEVTFGLDADGKPFHPDPQDPTQPRYFKVRTRLRGPELSELAQVAEKLDAGEVRPILEAITELGGLLGRLIGDRYPDVTIPPLSTEEAGLLLGALFAEQQGASEAARAVAEAEAPPGGEAASGSRNGDEERERWERFLAARE